MSSKPYTPCPRVSILTSSLPTVVVAGNQSSGKSSLIEAISGVNLVVMFIEADDIRSNYLEQLELVREYPSRSDSSEMAMLPDNTVSRSEEKSMSKAKMT